VGAWIETQEDPIMTDPATSRPAWARGLKLHVNARREGDDVSRPAWARGLKLIGVVKVVKAILSRPAWARGLKHPCRTPR